MDGGTVVTAALLTLAGLTAVNVIVQFFQLAVEEFKKCSIIRKGQKIIRQTEMSRPEKLPSGAERAGEENAVFAGGWQRACTGPLSGRTGRLVQGRRG